LETATERPTILTILCWLSLHGDFRIGDIAVNNPMVTEGAAKADRCQAFF
jgi:hypothetical protein